MKRKFIGGIIILVLIAIPIVLYMVLLRKDESIKDGIYIIEDSEEFPNAYIEIEGDVIWIREMDLNSIYPVQQLEWYEELEAEGRPIYSKEFLDQASDYNYIFGERGYNIKYATTFKDGTYINVWNCEIGNSTFSLRITYNSAKDTIKVSDIRGSYAYTFKRK